MNIDILLSNDAVLDFFIDLRTFVAKFCHRDSRTFSAYFLRLKLKFVHSFESDCISVVMAPAEVFSEQKRPREGTMSQS